MTFFDDVLSLPKVPVMNLVTASMFAFSGATRLLNHEAIVWYMCRLLGAHLALVCLLTVVDRLAKNHPLATRERILAMLSRTAAQLLNFSKLGAAAIALQYLLPSQEIAQLYATLVLYLVAVPFAMYAVTLLMGALPSTYARLWTSFSDVTPADDIRCIAAVLNPTGRTFTGVPPSEQVYREFKPTHPYEKTSAVPRENSVTKGSEGEARCKVLNEGPHFNRTAGGCLLPQ